MPSITAHQCSNSEDGLALSMLWVSRFLLTPTLNRVSSPLCSRIQSLEQESHVNSSHEREHGGRVSRAELWGATRKFLSPAVISRGGSASLAAATKINLTFLDGWSACLFGAKQSTLTSGRSSAGRQRISWLEAAGAKGRYRLVRSR